MRYKDKACEIVGIKEVIGQGIIWILLMEGGGLLEVPNDALKHQQKIN
jgi:hypothetical protein